MAINNFIDVSGLTYAGDDAKEIFSKEIYNLDLRGYGITLMDGVKGKMKIYNGEVGDVYQAYSCPFSPKGEVVLSEDFIEPVAIQVNLENCYSEFWNTYLVEQTSITLNGGIPQTFFEWFFNDKLIKKMDKEYQEIFWQGDSARTATTKEYLKITNGIEAILKKNGNTVAGSNLTVDNIEAQIEAAIASAMTVAADNETELDDYKIFMNKNDIRTLAVALGKDCTCNTTNSVFANYTKDGDRLFVYGLEVVPCECSRNTIIVAPARNLVLGFDTFDSHLEYRIIDMRETTGDNAFRVIALSNIAVGVVYPQLAVISYVA